MNTNKKASGFRGYRLDELELDDEVSRAVALRELTRHGFAAETPQFLSEVGDRETYLIGEVIGWMGY